MEEVGSRGYEDLVCGGRDGFMGAQSLVKQEGERPRTSELRELIFQWEAPRNPTSVTQPFLYFLQLDIPYIHSKTHCSFGN